MNAVDVIAEAAQTTGYRGEAIFKDYAFADVLDPQAITRKVVLAAFTQTPPSYRSAAIAAVLAGEGTTPELVRGYRALGAPLLFVLESDHLSLWQVRGDVPRRMRDNLSISDVPALFAQHRKNWHPDAIHRAKSIGSVDQSYQLDFVDIGLLPAVEGEIHSKLDRLLSEALAAALNAQSDHRLDAKVLFRIIFRLLAAKVLRDRRHSYAHSWDLDDLDSILHAIESYYSLHSVSTILESSTLLEFSEVWECLRNGISFANISSDDLAFVYENTLVTPETRKHLGTHSTPRQLAEYAVMQLGLHRYSPEVLNIYEPFSGAGIFLVSALRHLRELLPVDWNDQQRHEFLIHHLAGDEIDAFACEVAMLSLILADYPNRNGWRITECDLFEDSNLDASLRKYNVVLCNPPFEDFTADERLSYAIKNKSYSKPVEAFRSILNAHPLAFAIVLPRTFILDEKFSSERKVLEKLYSDIEVVELPDRLFRFSNSESALVIAREQRPPGRTITTLCSTEVSDHTRVEFLKTGKVTVRRQAERAIEGSISGDLWIQQLDTVWKYLQTAPRLGENFQIHRGIEWQKNQKRAWTRQSMEGYRRGLHSARRGRQFVVANSVWLDCRADSLKGGAIGLPWEQQKLIVNATRLSRGPWRIGSALDKDGLLCSQQYFGVWPNEALSEKQLLASVAVLNGPVANAYLATHSPASRLRISVVEQIPMPIKTLPHLENLVEEYVRHLDESGIPTVSYEHLETLLTQIDAEVLRAYGLPWRLERQILDYFCNVERPVAHSWRHWNIQYPTPGLTLFERVSGRFSERGSWIHEVFQPLPIREADLLRTYGA